MLTLHSKDGSIRRQCEPGAGPIGPDDLWVDLKDWDKAEVDWVERSTGLQVPSFDELVEIENSSRVHMEGDALYLTTPAVYRGADQELTQTFVGFVLTHERLITTRYADLKSFEDVEKRPCKDENGERNATSILIALLNAMVDRMADGLERVGTDLDAVAKHVFGHEAMSGSIKRPARQDADLRQVLAQIGRCGERASRVRDSLLGLGRIVPYVLEMTEKWATHDQRASLKSLRQDLMSLSDYDAHLTNRVQFLLDATLGLINIEQNTIIKVLTIVSVVGVPPTLVASMYGMNFKNMPELNWAFGYPYALILILVSAVAPLAWFKVRGWL